MTFAGETTFDLSGAGGGVSPEALEQLKSNSIKCLTDTLFKKLLDMEEVREELGRVGCVCVLIRALS